MFINEEISNEFDFFKNMKISYFDYAATSIMPNKVIDKWVDYQKNVTVFYGKGNNILANQAMETFKKAEDILHYHFGIGDDYDLVYGKNTTELINLMALSLNNHIKPLDYILVGPFEHHSNLLPWKYLAKRSNAVFFEMPLTASGSIDYDYLNSIKESVKVVAISSVSNTTAYKMDINRVCDIFSNSLIFVDESQLVAHQRIEKHNNITGHMLNSHKMYGPKNIGGAFVKKSFLKSIDPVLIGGGMVNVIGFEDTWGEGKHKFEAGTLDVGSIAAWSEACKFIDNIGYDYIEKLEEYCYDSVVSALNKNKGIRIIGNEHNCSKSLVSFVCEKYHAHDVEHFLAANNVIIRSGNLCAQPAIRKFGEIALNRISFGLGIKNEDLHRICDLIGEL